MICQLYKLNVINLPLPFWCASMVICLTFANIRQQSACLPIVTQPCNAQFTQNDEAVTVLCNCSKCMHLGVNEGLLGDGMG